MAGAIVIILLMPVLRLLPLLFLYLLPLFTSAQTRGTPSGTAGVNQQKFIAIVPLDQTRVKEIAAMLPEKPRGIGRPYYERAAWNKMLRSGKFRQLLADADEAMAVPLPAMTDDIYLSFFNSNDSETSKKLTVRRRLLFSTMVWAECLVNEGKYMPAIEAAILDFVNLKSWNFPAEDRKKLNFEGRQYTINLSPADYAIELANAAYLLADKLNPSLQKKIKDALYLRVFKPALQAIETNNGSGEFVSLTSTGNHNAATLSGVTGAALAAIESKEERAVFVAIAERYSQNSILGFLNDGYCTEGLGYFNYGMRHFSVLRENLWQATGGRIDLFSSPKLKKIALFAPGMQIINGIYPSIGDCEPGIKPDKYLMAYLARALGLYMPEYEKYADDGPANAPLINLMYFFPRAASIAPAESKEMAADERRTYFPDAGVLTVRPAAHSSFNMAATLKGGNNNEQHNHNDIGSFTVVAGDELLMGDPGLATYTSKTFSPDRYSIRSLTSFGHPVPVLDGRLQLTGARAQAVITSTGFSNNRDTLVMDISSGYDVPGLERMLRTFIYNRLDTGFLRVEDRIEFDAPKTFETALTTRARWKQLSPGTIELSGTKEKLLVTIIVPGSGFSLYPELITETPVPFTRLGIRLNEPIANGVISMTFRPVR